MRKISNHHHPGLALKAVRTQKGLSLRALAAETAIPFSTLSKLENGKMGMSYDKLVRLAQGLGVDVSELVAGGRDVATESAPAVGRYSISRAEKNGHSRVGKFSHHYPAADILEKLMIPIILEVTARSIEEVGELLRHSGEEYLYIVSGAMELHSSLYTPITLKAGDSIYFDSGMAHAYVRISVEPCRVISVCAGPGIQPLAALARKHQETATSE